jgi:hypothetical protein
MAGSPRSPKFIAGKLLGEGQESCIFQSDNEHLVISVFQKRPSEPEIQKLETLNKLLLEKDPEQRFFVSAGTIHSAPIDRFVELFPYIRLSLCSGDHSDQVSFAMLPKLTPFVKNAFNLEHLRRGLTLLHSSKGTSVVHGDIKMDNLMMHKDNAVFIDFGHSKIWSGSESPGDSRSIARDLEYFENLFKEEPARPAKRRFANKSPDVSDSPDRAEGRGRFEGGPLKFSFD